MSLKGEYKNKNDVKQKELQWFKNKNLIMCKKRTTTKRMDKF